MTATPLNNKLDTLRARMEALQPGLIAVSGGLDSRLLLHLSSLWSLDFQIVHAMGPHQSPLEQRQTLTLFKLHSVFPRLVRFDPLSIPEVRTNNRERCYLCKKTLFNKFLEFAAPDSRNVLDGTQHDDLATHRPGHKALKQLAVQSPLAWAGMTKNDIREAALCLDLPDPNQPSRACLLTRFPYDHGINLSDLTAVGRVEDGLWALGLRRFRFRITGRKANLLQIHPEEEVLWQNEQKKVLDLVAANDLDPFEVSATPNMSGYFDT